MAKLILFGPKGPEDYKLGNVLTIGRRSNNTLRLLESFVSREHIKITKTDSGYVLEDVSSKNGVGVIVNNVRIKGVVGRNPSHKLRHNDIILINDIQMSFDDPESDPDSMPTMVPASIRDKLKEYEKGAPATAFQQAAKEIAPNPIAVAAQLRSDAAAAKKPDPAKSNPKTAVKGDAKSGGVETLQQSPATGATIKFAHAGLLQESHKPKKSDANNASAAKKSKVNAALQASAQQKAALAAVAAAPAAKRKLPTAAIVLSVLALAAMAGFVWMQVQPLLMQQIQRLTRPANAVADAKVALKAGRVEAAEKLLTDYKGRLTDQETNEIRAAIDNDKRVRRAQQIRETLTKNDFEEARRMAQAELTAGAGEEKDDFYALSETATSALNIQKFYENATGAEKNFDAAQLRGIDANLQDALEEFVRNKQKLDEYKKAYGLKDGKAMFEPIDFAQNAELARIHGALIPLKKTVEERLVQLQSAQKTWDDARAAQMARKWADEQNALEQLALAPPEIAATVLKGKTVQNLLSNLRHFVAGNQAVEKRQLKMATEEFGRVAADDAHREAADHALAAATKTLKLEDARVLHASGHSDDAIKNLDAMAGDADAREFRDHITKVMDGYNAVKGAQAARVSAQIIKQATAFASTLDARDGWYKTRADESLMEARRNGSMLKLARLRQLFYEKNFDAFHTDMNKFLADVDRNTCPDLYDKAIKVQAKADEQISEDAAKNVGEAIALWQQYASNKISARDRSNIDAAALITFAARARALAEVWSKIRDANQFAQLGASVKPELRDSSKMLYDQVIAEVIQQSSELYNKVRRAGELAERPDYVKIAEERILMLPDVPNNEWYQRVKSGKK